MEFQDDRTKEQKALPHLIVLATDRFLSGWGGAGDGPSFAGWACAPDSVKEVTERIEAQAGMRNVRLVLSTYRPKAGAGHVHIYVDDSLKAAGCDADEESCKHCGEPLDGLTMEGAPCADCAEGPLSCHRCNGEEENGTHDPKVPR